MVYDERFGGGMILIKSVDFIETDSDPYELYHKYADDKVFFVDPKELMKEVEYTSEFVYGKQFRRPSDGKDIIIGVSKQAQEVIGIMYEAWETQAKRYDDLRKACDVERQYKYWIINEFETYKNNIKQATFWQRLKWVIYGSK